MLSNTNDGVVFGGAEVQISLLAQYLAEEGLDVSVVVRTYQKPFIKTINGIRIINYAERKKFRSLGADSFFSLFKTLSSQKPDIVVCRLKEKVFFLAVLYAKFFKKKIAFMVAHDDTISPQSFKGFEGWVFKKCLSASDVVFTQNNFQYQTFVEQFGRDPVFLPNSFSISNQPIEHKEYVLWVGRSDEWKQPHIFLDLSKKFLHEKFVMVCTKGNNSSAWQKVASAAEQCPNVTFIEQVPFSKNQDLYNKAKVFINTSTTEGFPNSFLNCGLAQTPILSLAVNPNDLFATGKAGLCAGGNVEQLHKHLENLLRDPEQQKLLGAGIRDYVKTHHDITQNGLVFKNSLLGSLAGFMD